MLNKQVIAWVNLLLPAEHSMLSYYFLARILFLCCFCISCHAFRAFRTSLTKVSSLSLAAPKIALTREQGANDKLLSFLSSYDCVETPCLRFEDLTVPLEKFKSKLAVYDIVAITSPQAASVFLRLLNEVGPHSLKVASIGAGTSEVLNKGHVSPMFEPSRATAECMASEIPLEMGKSVFYPASELADTTLSKYLQKRGFKVSSFSIR